MPLYYFKCDFCGATKRRVCSSKQAKEQTGCDCGGIFVRDPKPPSTSSKETLDNGIMARAVTRYTDAEEVYSKLSEKADKERNEP